MSTESDKTPLGEEIPENQDPVTYRLGWFFWEMTMDILRL